MNPLQQAIRDNNINELQLLLDLGYDVNAKDNKGETPLFEAVRHGKIEIGRLLIKNGADIDLQNNEKKSSIFFAESIEMIDLLLENRADINTKDFRGRTILFYFCYSDNDIKTFKYLIRKGADINICDEHENSLLMYASAWNLKTMTYLLKLGLDIEMKNDLGETALFQALRLSYKTLNFFVSHGADVNTKNKKGKTPLHCLIEEVQLDFEAVKCLLENGANPNICDHQGKTPLHYLVNRDKFSLKIAELLMEYGSDPNMTDKNGKTPFHDLVLPGFPGLISHFYPEYVDLFSEYGADFNIKDKEGETLLFKYVNSFVRSARTPTESQKELKVIIELLIQNSAAIDAKNLQGYNALIVALLHRRIEIIDIMADNGAKDISFLDAEGNNLVHLISKKSKIEETKVILSKLIAYGADINAKNNNDETPLFLALQNFGSESFIKLMIKHGADTNSTDISRYIENHTLVNSTYYHKMVPLLIENGADIKRVPKLQRHKVNLSLET